MMDIRIVHEDVHVTLGDVPIHAHRAVPYGEYRAALGAVFTHPLDYIALRHRGDPHAHLDASLGWQLAKIEHQASLAIANIDLMHLHLLEEIVVAEHADGGL